LSVRRGSASTEKRIEDVMPRLLPALAVLSACIAALATSGAPAHGQDVTVIAYPRIYNFPGQQLCQVDRSDRRYREFCAPQSYHAFGASGYRPFGTYQAYRPHRFVRRTWPSAKVLQVDPSL
jgi:hypothetical protein